MRPELQVLREETLPPVDAVTRERLVVVRPRWSRRLQRLLEGLPGLRRRSYVRETREREQHWAAGRVRYWGYRYSGADLLALLGHSPDPALGDVEEVTHEEILPPHVARTDERLLERRYVPGPGAPRRDVG